MFIIGTVGISILSGNKIGYILYFIHISAVIIYALLFRNKAPCTFSITLLDNTVNKSAFTASVRETASSIVNISVYIVFFSVICELITAFSPFKNDILTSLICGLCEISNGCIMLSISSVSSPLKLSLISAIISLSGLCITLQTADILYDTGISIKKYITGKIKIAIISFCISYIIFSLYPPLINVFNDCSVTIKSHTGYIFWAAFIPSMIILYLNTRN